MLRESCLLLCVPNKSFLELFVTANILEIFVRLKRNCVKCGNGFNMVMGTISLFFSRKFFIYLFQSIIRNMGKFDNLWSVFIGLNSWLCRMIKSSLIFVLLRWISLSSIKTTLMAQVRKNLTSSIQPYRHGIRVKTFRL